MFCNKDLVVGENAVTISPSGLNYRPTRRDTNQFHPMHRWARTMMLPTMIAVPVWWSILTSIMIAPKRCEFDNATTKASLITE